MYNPISCASYGSCFVEHYSTILSVRCGPSSVNIDLTVPCRPDSRKSGTMLHIGVVDMRTTLLRLKLALDFPEEERMMQQ